MSCRTALKNKSGAKGKSTDDGESISTKSILKRSKVNLFNSKEQCFYCKELCVLAKKNRERQKNLKECLPKTLRFMLKG